MKKDVYIIGGIVLAILLLFGFGYGTGVHVQNVAHSVYVVKATALESALSTETDAVVKYQREVAAIEGTLLLVKKPQATKDAITKVKQDMQSDLDNLRQIEKFNKLK